jgi:hypothetical protein
MSMNPNHVVVDGSNLATEGRTLPSLAQLEEAIAAYEEEHPAAELTVVVDATFEHRIDESERDRFKAAELRGEFTAPPAGAVGRGDAFILKIAKKADAIVLSNDSFQEFHGEHPWLFEEGRLIGGKPVPALGWIFTPRNPVRGPKSRAATKAAAKNAGPAKKLSVTRPDGSKPQVGDTLTPTPPSPPKKLRAYELARELGIENKELLALAKSAKVAVASHSSSVGPAEADKLRSAHANRKVRASELAEELGLDLKALKALAASIDVKVSTMASSLAGADAARLRTAQSRALARAERTPQLLAELESGEDADGEEPGQGRSRRRRRRRRGVSSDSSGSELLVERPEPSAEAPGNEPLDLITFLATHEVGGELEGTVSSFTSHGAMVEVPLGHDRSFHCYVRTVNLGDPAPTRARDAIAKGSSYRFSLLAVDVSRRVAELRLVVDATAPMEQSGAASAEERAAEPRRRSRRGRGRSRGTGGEAQGRTHREQPGGLTSSAQSSTEPPAVGTESAETTKGVEPAAPAKKATTTKAATTKKASPSKASAPKAAPAKKATVKKATAKKATAKKATAKKTSPKKATTKKAAATKDPAAKAAAKRSTRDGSR